MRDSGNVGAGHVELVYAEELSLRGGHFAAPGLYYVGHQQHVGAVAVEFEPIADALAQDRGRKGPDRFTILDPEVERFLHERRARITQDRAVAQRTAITRPKTRSDDPPTCCSLVRSSCAIFLHF